MENKNFNLKAYLDAAADLLLHDETERALHLLDNLPAYYRDHLPVEVYELKKDILSRFATTHFYSTGGEVIDSKDVRMMRKTLRGHLLVEEVKFINSHGEIPHIIDYGPGDFWLPFVLIKEKLKFTYQPITLNNQVFLQVHDIIKDHIAEKHGPTIFVACEVIEHLWDEREIQAQVLRCGTPDVIHVSTPKYTYNVGLEHWRDIPDIGHLRAYTPGEFYNKLISMFPTYKHQRFDSKILHVRMVNSYYELFKDTMTDNPFNIAGLVENAD